MEYINVGELIILLSSIISIPSIITALISNRINKKLDNYEQKSKESNQAREMEAFLLLKNLKAQGGLIEKIAMCVKNNKVNGDMDSAFEYAKEQKHELEDFLDKQAIKINH